jgi:hypothetical protein
LNSGLYFLRFSCIYRPPFRTGPYWVPYPETGRHARWHLRDGQVDGRGIGLVHEHAEDGGQLVWGNINALFLRHAGVFGLGDVLLDERDDSFFLHGQMLVHNREEPLDGAGQGVARLG